MPKFFNPPKAAKLAKAFSPRYTLSRIIAAGGTLLLRPGENLLLSHRYIITPPFTLEFVAEPVDMGVADACSSEGGR